jgi:hypothetical protein
MSGSLVLIDEEIVSSAVASVTLTGINSTYDVYMVSFNNVEGATDATYLSARVTESGTANTTANYDRAGKGLYGLTTFVNTSATNQTLWRVNGAGQSGTATGEQHNGNLYLFNFNSTTEYAFITSEITAIIADANLYGEQGGGVFSNTGTARDGIQFFMESGNISSGTFKLYGLKK